MFAHFFGIFFFNSQLSLRLSGVMKNQRRGVGVRCALYGWRQKSTHEKKPRNETFSRSHYSNEHIRSLKSRGFSSTEFISWCAWMPGGTTAAADVTGPVECGTPLLLHDVRVARASQQRFFIPFSKCHISWMYFRFSNFLFIVPIYHFAVLCCDAERATLVCANISRQPDLPCLRLRLLCLPQLCRFRLSTLDVDNDKRPHAMDGWRNAKR